MLGGRYADLDDPRAPSARCWTRTPSTRGARRATTCASSLAAGIGRDRVEEVLALVGLEHAADRSVGGYSLGMRQRLGLAGALLGDPQILVLDEPTNGLDPEGIRWLRDFLRATPPRAHRARLQPLLAEVAQTVDDVVIIAHGRLRAAARSRSSGPAPAAPSRSGPATPPSCAAGSPPCRSMPPRPATTGC